MTLAWLSLGALAGGHAIMYKRDARSAALWLFISFSFPFIGPWLYWVLGINRIERRAAKLLKGRERPLLQADDFGWSAIASPDSMPVGHLTALRSIADRVTRLPLLGGNRVQPLHNGEEAYPAMLAAIDASERSVTLASYIFDWDDVGRRFADALDAAAHRGVRVHVLVDGIGALGSFSRMGRRLLQSGAEVASFFPLRFPLGRLRINLRNHRKILVVDGRVGFTGGMNISCRHLLANENPGRAEDLHFRIDGPVVAELQHAFCEDWLLAKGDTLVGADYFPSLVDAGPAQCRAIISGPDEDLQKIHWILLGALASAQQSVRMVTPYFVPSAALVGAIVMAALRGVRVTLVLPAVTDLPFMRWAADAYLWQLLEHGVQVVRRPPPFVHTKLLIVDERWLLLGSANIDHRSFRLNFELNVEVYDAELAMELSRWLDGVVATSLPVTLEDMDSRPGWKRLRDGWVKLFSSYL